MEVYGKTFKDKSKRHEKTSKSEHSVITMYHVDIVACYGTSSGSLRDFHVDI
jgi:hypothetical protein